MKHVSAMLRLGTDKGKSEDVACHNARRNAHGCQLAADCLEAGSELSQQEVLKRSSWLI